MQRDRSILLAGAAILALGCFGTTTPVAQLPSLSDTPRMGPVIQALAGRIAIVLPLVPLGLALLLLPTPSAPRSTHMPSVLAILLLLGGLPLVALNALVSGQGAAIALAQGADSGPRSGGSTRPVLAHPAGAARLARHRDRPLVRAGSGRRVLVCCSRRSSGMASGIARGRPALLPGPSQCRRRSDHLACRSARLCLLHDGNRLQGQLELVFPRPADRRRRLWPPSLQLVAAAPAIRSAGPPGSFHCRHAEGVRASGAVPALARAAVMTVHPGPNIQSTPATVAFGHVGPRPPRDQGKAPSIPPP